jgi:hypothetical protein
MVDQMRRGASVSVMATAIFVSAFAFRAIIILHRGNYQTLSSTENVRVAVALLRKRQLADVFGPGTGPSAHVSPVYPMLLSLVFRVAGTGAAGELAKRLFAAFLASVTYALFPFVGIEVGIQLEAAVCAGLLMGIRSP